MILHRSELKKMRILKFINQDKLGYKFVKNSTVERLLNENCAKNEFKSFIKIKYFLHLVNNLTDDWHSFAM